MHGAIGNAQLKSLCLEMDEWYTWSAGAGRQAGGPRLLLRETSGRGMTLSLSPWLKQNPSDPHSIKKKNSSNSKNNLNFIFILFIFGCTGEHVGS